MSFKETCLHRNIPAGCTGDGIATRWLKTTSYGAEYMSLCQAHYEGFIKEASSLVIEEYTPEEAWVFIVMES